MAKALDGSGGGEGRAKARPQRRPPAPAGPAPTRAKLHEAALLHLARFGTTEAGLVRVLDRRIDRWARRAAAEAQGAGALGGEAPDTAAARAAAREVARALVGAGVVDDAAYAAGRARSLARAGRSRRAIGAHLAMKGVAQAAVQAVLPEPEAELAAALAYARRRRLGPFRAALPEGADPADVRRRETGALARAGFPQPVAQQALRMGRDEAEAVVTGLKRG